MSARSALSGALVLLAVTLASGTLPDAHADFAGDCSAPTRTLSGGGSASISVAAGETLLLTSGSFTGGVDSFPAGSRLCVAGSAGLSPPYLNNAAGALVVGPGGSAVFGSIAVATGFSLSNEGDVRFGGLNVNGAATITNLAGGTVTISSQFSPSAGGIVNEGVLNISGGMNLNSNASLTNRRYVTVTGSSTVNGAFVNTGLANVTGSLTVNGSGTLDNRCALVTTADLTNGGSSANAGLTEVGGTFSNNGSWRQADTGTTRSAALRNDGSTTGFGRFQVSGASSTQNSFAGDSAAAPIVVDDATPPAPPQIFDTQSGAVVNVVAGAVRAEPAASYPAPGCTDAPRPSADVTAEKSAPARVQVGDTVVFTITVTNEGEGAADDVVVADSLPATLGGVTASDGGVVAGGTVTWELGTLADGAVRELTVTGTATAVGTLLNQVSSTAATPDPNPGNNDGSSEAANTSTVVEDIPPPANQPPVAEDGSFTGQTGQPVLGRLVATDPDDGQELRFTKASDPTHGSVVVLGSGVFFYTPDPEFAGRDSFTYQACDNADPPLCDTAVVDLAILPVARDDAAVAAEGTPVDVPVSANDSPGAQVGAVTAGPANGTTTVTGPGSISYAPDTGFLGVDTFTYSWCSPEAPPLCDTAEVTVEVIAANRPPVIDPATLVTVTGQEVTGTVAADDPDGDTVTHARGIPPRSGTALVAADGTVTYVPRGGFSGVDSFSVIACDDGEPELCSTALVTVNVYPVATDDADRTTAGVPVTIPVLANDAGAGNEPPEVVTQPGSGQVRVQGRSIVYLPDDGFTGTDTFTYRICSPGSVPLCSEATVTVVVEDAPEPPPPPVTPPGVGPSAGYQSGGVAPSVADLAETGGPGVGLLGLGVALLAAGAGLLRIGRKRHPFRN